MSSAFSSLFSKNSPPAEHKEDVQATYLPMRQTTAWQRARCVCYLYFIDDLLIMNNFVATISASPWLNSWARWSSSCLALALTVRLFFLLPLLFLLVPKECVFCHRPRSVLTVRSRIGFLLVLVGVLVCSFSGPAMFDLTDDATHRQVLLWADGSVGVFLEGILTLLFVLFIPTVRYPLTTGLGNPWDGNLASVPLEKSAMSVLLDIGRCDGYLTR